MLSIENLEIVCGTQKMDIFMEFLYSSDFIELDRFSH